MFPTLPLFLAAFSPHKGLKKKAIKSHLAGLQLNRWRPELLLLRGHSRASTSASATSAEARQGFQPSLSLGLFGRDVGGSGHNRTQVLTTTNPEER